MQWSANLGLTITVLSLRARVGIILDPSKRNPPHSYSIVAQDRNVKAVMLHRLMCCQNINVQFEMLRVAPLHSFGGVLLLLLAQ